jgi:hypothetical protein
VIVSVTRPVRRGIVVAFRSSDGTIVIDCG